MVSALQVSRIPLHEGVRAQQLSHMTLAPAQASSLPMQATTLGTTTSQLDINTLIQPLITIMIVMMMMKMMTGAMGSVAK